MDRLVIAATVGLVIIAGCSAPRPVRSVSNPNPAGKIPAIKEAVRERDRDASRQLVKDLDSDDPAVRFYAIGGLQRLTGETFGYRYYDDEIERQPAIKRWKQWLAGEENEEGGAGGGGQQHAAGRDIAGAADASRGKASEP